MNEAVARRERLLAEFEAAIPADIEVECRAVGTEGIEPVRTELLYDRFVHHLEGSRAVAIQWLTEKTDEAFLVRFLVLPRTESRTARVWLKYWEPPDSEPAWPVEWPTQSGSAA